MSLTLFASPPFCSNLIYSNHTSAKNKHHITKSVVSYIILIIESVPHQPETEGSKNYSLLLKWVWISDSLLVLHLVFKTSGIYGTDWQPQFCIRMCNRWQILSQPFFSNPLMLHSSLSSGRSNKGVHPTQFLHLIKEVSILFNTNPYFTITTTF